jgi:hypothetical protein
MIPVQTIQRGKEIEIKWARNNHAAGFIRIAWARTERSDDHSAFDENVQLLTCHEMTCKSSNPSDPFGGDNDGGAEGKCSSKVIVPAQLSDGQWTMQWSWFGGAFALGDYYSCVDYKVHGGQSVSSSPLPINYIGGDIHNPGTEKCKFFNTDRLHVCANEPCQNGNMPGQHDGVPSGRIGMAFAKQGISALSSAKAESEEAVSSDKRLVTSTPETKSQSLPTSLSSVKTNSKTMDSQENSLGLSVAAFTSGDVVAQYSVTFEDPSTSRFGALLRVSTVSGNLLEQWSVILRFPIGQNLTEVIGASIHSVPSNETGMHRYKIESVQRLDGSTNVGLLGFVSL